MTRIQLRQFEFFKSKYKKIQIYLKLILTLTHI